jgi:hypothetical protein
MDVTCRGILGPLVSNYGQEGVIGQSVDGIAGRAATRHQSLVYLGLASSTNNASTEASREETPPEGGFP